MRIFPVVHVNTRTTAAEQAAIALNEGADGVYLIHHRGESAVLFDVLGDVLTEFPRSFIGVNLLGFSTLRALWELEQAVETGRIPRAPDGLWSDDIRSDSDPFAPIAYARASSQLHSIRILGGICFKYTATSTDDPVEARDEVMRLRDAVDVVTTSGSGTGTPPSLEKMRAMREAADRPLAVASGISADNLSHFQSLIDEVLVASSIETRPYSGEFDLTHLRRTIRAVHDLT